MFHSAVLTDLPASPSKLAIQTAFMARMPPKMLGNKFKLSMATMVLVLAGPAGVCLGLIYPNRGIIVPRLTIGNEGRGMNEQVSIECAAEDDYR